MSSQPAYRSRAISEESGLEPSLQAPHTAEICTICREDLACEASGADHKPLSEAEKTFLEGVHPQTNLLSILELKDVNTAKFLSEA